MRLSEAEKADRRMKARECMSDPTLLLPPFVEPVALMTSPTAKPAIAALVAAETYSAHEAGGALGIRSDGRQRHSLQVLLPYSRLQARPP